MKNIIFIAPPAAGKGTISKMLNEEYNIPHISTGDLLREEVEKKSAVGTFIEEEMNKGNLIDDEIITDLLKSRLCLNDCDNGFILDGYPRNLSQAITYNKLLNEIDRELGVVILFDISDEILRKRITSRLVCSKCGASYNLNEKELMPKQEGICDKCNSNLKVRSDDNLETFAKRMDTYNEFKNSLVDYYKEQNILKTIKISNTAKAIDIYNRVKEIIND